MEHRDALSEGVDVAGDVRVACVARVGDRGVGERGIGGCVGRACVACAGAGQRDEEDGERRAKSEQDRADPGREGAASVGALTLGAKGRARYTHREHRVR